MHLSPFATTPRQGKYTDSGQLLKTAQVHRAPSALAAGDAEKEEILARARDSPTRTSMLGRMWRRFEENGPSMLSCLDSEYLPPAAVSSRKCAVLLFLIGFQSALSGLGNMVLPLLPLSSASVLSPVLGVLGALRPDALVPDATLVATASTRTFDRENMRVSWGTGGALDMLAALVVLLGTKQYHRVAGEGALPHAACLLTMMLALSMHVASVFDVVTLIAAVEGQARECEAVAQDPRICPSAQIFGSWTDAIFALPPIVATAALLSVEFAQIYHSDRARVALLSPPAGGQRGGASLV